MDKEFNGLEFARTIGQPLDPRKPYADLIAAICQTETADPDEFVYKHDALQDTDQVIVLAAGGKVVPVQVTPQAPTLLNFVGISTPPYFVTVDDLADAKESTLARKNQTVNRSLDAEEIKRVIDLLDAAAIAEGNTHTLGAETKFKFSHLIAMREDVRDYGNDYVLVEGSQIAEDIDLWNWDDNKFQAPLEMLEALGVTRVRIPTVAAYDRSTDGGTSYTSTTPLGTNLAYLVARDTLMGRPLLWVRKLLTGIEVMGAPMATEAGTKPQRWTIISPVQNKVVLSESRVGVDITGYEKVVGSVVNTKAISKFERVAP